MTKEQLQVKEWMINFGQETHDSPTEVDISVLRLRAKLMIEEVLEAVCEGFGLSVYFSVKGKDSVLAITEEDLVNKKLELAFLKAKPLDLAQASKKICDLHYVSYTGTGAALGVDMEPIFAAVHENNLNKMWTEEEVKTRDKEKYPYAEEKDSKTNRKYSVTDNHGKIMKSPSYSPADIKSVLEKQKVH